MSRALIILAMLVVFAGCAARHQLEEVADAAAGAKAYQAEADPVKRATIAIGLAAHVLAATANVPGLPAPALTSAEIQADPDAYADAGLEAQEDPPPFVAEDQPAPGPSPSTILREIGATALRWGAWGAIAGIVALLLRFVPWWGIGAVFSWGPLTTIAGVSASIGSFSTIAGSAAMWMADYLWIVALVTALSAAGVAAFHWPQIRKAWRHVLTHLRKG